MKQLALLFLFSVLVFGCVKDDTVTEFTELNEITIEGIDVHYTVLLQHRLQITPEIITSKNDDSNLSYVWYVHRTTAATSKDTISFERNLDVVMIPQYTEPGVDYTLNYKVTDNSTGVYTRTETSLLVTTPYSAGTLLLCKKDGATQLNFLNYDTPRTLLEDVFASANEGLTPGDNPLNIYSIDPNQYRPYMKNVFIACSNATGGYYLDPQTFKIDMPFNEGFEKTPPQNPLTTSLYQKKGIIEYIITNGEVRKRATNAGAFNWETPCVFLEGETEYEAAPIILPNLSIAIFYDQKNQRFFKHDPFNKGYLSRLDTVATNQVFSPHHVGDNLRLMAWGKETGNVGDFWMLMRNTITQRLFVYKFNIRNNSSTSSYEFLSRAIIEISESNAPHIYQAEWFSSNDVVNDILMYATKDKVYSFNMHQLTQGSGSLIEAEQIDAASQNLEITKMEYVQVQVPNPTESNPTATRSANQIRLSVLDHSLSAHPGGFSIYEVTTTGGLHSTMVYTKTGFCDEVVDIDEKYN